MLLLSRKRMERIRIRVTEPCDVWFTVLDWDGSKVQIGIQAPLSAAIMRAELLTPEKAVEGPTP